MGMSSEHYCDKLGQLTISIPYLDFIEVQRQRISKNGGVTQT